MQTFLPYESFVESARCLDQKRLGKQRVECLQIMHTLMGESEAWENHPAVRMWRRHEGLLLLYAYAICDEWISRGYNDSVREQLEDYEFAVDENSWFEPDWLGDEDFHRSHQSNLVRKDPTYYRQYFPDVPDNLEYVWPVEAPQGT